MQTYVYLILKKFSIFAEQQGDGATCFSVITAQYFSIWRFYRWLQLVNFSVIFLNGNWLQRVCYILNPRDSILRLFMNRCLRNSVIGRSNFRQIVAFSILFLSETYKCFFFVSYMEPQAEKIWEYWTKLLYFNLFSYFYLAFGLFMLIMYVDVILLLHSARKTPLSFRNHFQTFFTVIL